MAILEKTNLKLRTRLRSESVWVPLDWGGLLGPLTEQQAALDTLHRGLVENYLAVTDEAFEIKEFQRDRSAELDQAAIAQDRRLAEDKVALGREQLAIKFATDEYLLAVRLYDAKVRALIMGAREYAAEVEKEQLALEKSRTQLAVAREELHLEEINARVYYEHIQRAQVEVDLARAQVDVAKALVRALMADIEAERAAVEVVETEVQKYVALAEKATLQADVASIYAETLVHKLSAIKLDVGRQEIQAGFGYIQSRLTDMLAIWETRTLMEVIKAEAEAELQKEMDLLLKVEKAQEDLRMAEVESAREVFDYEVAQTDVNIAGETALRAGVVAARNALHDARRDYTINQMEKKTWVDALVHGAQARVYGTMTRERFATKKETLTISGGH